MAGNLSPTERTFLAHLEASMKEMDEIPGGLQAIIYGESGIGKTVAAMRMAVYLTPPEKTIVYIDSAQGYKVRRNHPDILARKMQRISYTTLTDLMGLCGIIEKQAEPLENVGAVIFDESTSMAADDLQVVVKNRAKFKTGDLEAVATPDYGVAQNRFMGLINRYSRLDGIHCIHIGHVRSDTLPSGLPQFSPSYTPKLGAVLRQPMDLVTYMTMNEKNERMFRNWPAKGIIAKSRVKGLEPNSDFKTLLRRTMDWLETNKTDPQPDQEVVETDRENEATDELMEI